MQDSGVASEVRLLVSVKESDRARLLLGPPRVLLQVPLGPPQVLLQVPLDLPQVPLGLQLGPPQVPLDRESDRAPLLLQRPLVTPVGESDRLPHVD